METTYFGTYDDWESKYGAKGHFFHRVDLHSELKRLAENPDSSPGFRAARIRLSAEVVDIDCEAGMLELADGQVFRKDIIVIADGVGSRFVHKISDDISPARQTGNSIFRFLIPTEKLQANPITAPLFPISQPSGMRIAVLGNRRMVWYPCRNGTEQNFAMIHADERYTIKTEDWHAGASKEDLLMTYKAFHPALVELCNQAENIKSWPLLYRPPNAAWKKGRAVLIGDAAHPMLPHQGQGGAQGLEDGAALGVLLSHVPEPSSNTTLEGPVLSSTSGDSQTPGEEAGIDAVIGERLQLFQDIRKNRTAAIQIFSNAGQDEAKKIQRDARPYVKGKVPTDQQQFHEYNFGYDVVEHCLLALKRIRGPESVALFPSDEDRLRASRCNL
jgi:salicylate hydroxylase